MKLLYERPSLVILSPIMVDTFRDLLFQRSERLGTRLVFALDLSSDLFSLNKSDREESRKDLFEQAASLIRNTEEQLAAVKINYPLVLALGPELTRELVAGTSVPCVGDFKVADIDNTSKWIGIHAYGMGFDAVIAQAFLGYEGGLEGLFEKARELGRAVILVINMSHPGSREFITPRAEDLAAFAVDHQADGVIAPATRPEEVRQARDWLGENMPMLTPGIGAQGGTPGDAISAGADFEIVGRGIYQSDNPAHSAEDIKKRINDTMAS